MRTDDSLVLRKIGKHQMIVLPSRDGADMTEVLTLNDTAAWLWQKAAGVEFTAGTLAGWLCSEYDVALETAQEDVEAMLDVWRSHGLVTED